MGDDSCPVLCQTHTAGRETTSRPGLALSRNSPEALYSCVTKCRTGTQQPVFNQAISTDKKKKNPRLGIDGRVFWTFASHIDFVWQIKRCRCLGRTGHRRSARQPPAGREWRHRSERGAQCPRPDCPCQPSGLAFGCQEKPWRRGLQGRTQTCTHTSHQPPEKRQKNIH